MQIKQHTFNAKQIILTCFFIFIVIGVSGQKGRILRGGYIVGYTKFNPAYHNAQVNQDPDIITRKYKDRVFPSYFDLWYGRFAESAFFDMNLGGLIYSLANKKTERIYKKMKNTDTSSIALLGADFNVFDFKMGFGNKGVYFGGQAGYTSFGPKNSAFIRKKLGKNPADTSKTTYAAFGSYGYYGLGLYFNIGEGKVFLQNSFVFNWLVNNKLGSASDKMKGKEFRYDGVYYFREHTGFYFGPYVAWRWFDRTFNKNEQTHLTARTFAIGLKLGFFVSEE